MVGSPESGDVDTVGDDEVNSSISRRLRLEET
jgi:hypothetical protein